MKSKVNEKYIPEYISFFTEMGKSLSEISRDIQNHESQRLEHILYIYFFPKNRELKHWIGELAAFSTQFALSKAKNGNKYPTSKFYFKNLWEPLFATEEDRYCIDYMAKNVNSHMKSNIVITDANRQDIVDKIKEFYTKLSILASRGDATRDNVAYIIRVVFKLN